VKKDGRSRAQIRDYDSSFPHYLELLRDRQPELFSFPSWLVTRTRSEDEAAPIGSCLLSHGGREFYTHALVGTEGDENLTLLTLLGHNGILADMNGTLREPGRDVLGWLAGTDRLAYAQWPTFLGGSSHTQTVSSGFYSGPNGGGDWTGIIFPSWERGWNLYLPQTKLVKVAELPRLSDWH